MNPDLANVTATSLSFGLEAALTRSHPRYHGPRPDEAHCYADAVLTIADATNIEWVTRASRTYHDASGEEDLDSLQRHGDRYEISGDWGHVRIHSTAAPRLDFTPES